MSLEQKKEIALENYKNARDVYMNNITKENWIKFCDAKRICMLLGVKI